MGSARACCVLGGGTLQSLREYVSRGCRSMQAAPAVVDDWSTLPASDKLAGQRAHAKDFRHCPSGESYTDAGGMCIVLESCVMTRTATFAARAGWRHSASATLWTQNLPEVAHSATTIVSR